MPAHRPNLHRSPTSLPLAYFITFRTYGTRLHGDPQGSTDRHHNTFNTPFLPSDPNQQRSAQSRLPHPPYLLTPQSATLIEQTITEVCTHRRWHLFIVHARTNHIHTLLTAPVSPERVMADLKAWSTRRLRQHNFLTPTRPAWAAHGSTRYLWTEQDLLSATHYVQTQQGPPLQHPSR